jgi:hypothetical protein
MVGVHEVGPEETVNIIIKVGGKTQFIKADVSNADHIEQLI